MFLNLGKSIIDIHDRLRLGKDRVFKPLVGVLPSNITPNDITAFRALFTLCWMPFALFYPSLWQVSLYLFVYFLDLLDGAVARLNNRVTYRGSYFDHVSDKFNNIAVLLVLYGVTGYGFDGFLFFIIWDMVSAFFVVWEVWSKNKILLYVRPPLEVLVKTALWLFLVVVFLRVS